MPRKRGSTPICPNCGSVDVHAVESGHRCGRCGHSGKEGRFFAHLAPGPSSNCTIPRISATDEEAHRQDAPFGSMPVDEFMDRWR